MSEKHMSMKEILEEFGWTRSWLFKAIRVYGLPSYKLGGKRVFDRGEVQTWIKERKTVRTA